MTAQTFCRAPSSVNFKRKCHVFISFAQSIKHGNRNSNQNSKGRNNKKSPCKGTKRGAALVWLIRNQDAAYANYTLLVFWVSSTLMYNSVRIHYTDQRRWTNNNKIKLDNLGSIWWHSRLLASRRLAGRYLVNASPALLIAFYSFTAY